MAPKQPPAHLITGKLAEDRSLDLLKRKGLHLVSRNYRCKSGEIDLVMEDGETLVFVEVRHREHHGYGSGADSITAAKRKRIIETASHFLRTQVGEPPACRFDVISSSGGTDNMQLDWIRNAFEL